MPVITLLNGKQIFYKHVVSLIKVAEDIQGGLSKFAIGAIVNGHVVSVRDMVLYDSTVYILTIQDKKSIYVFRYSCIQLLSYVIKNYFVDSKIVEGKITKTGFYCDIDIKNSLSRIELLKLEKLMYNVVKKNYNIFLKYTSYHIIKYWFYVKNEIYKLYYLKKNFLFCDVIPIYYHEKYLDFAFGPQLPNIKFCLNFKLQSISGAYWKDNKSYKMLQRIYGTVWLNEYQLSDFLNKCNLFKNKDHRLINKKMNLYHIAEDASGMVFWYENGLIIFQQLENFIRNQLKKWKYQEVRTPIIMNINMWKKSGHLNYFSDYMFYTQSEGQQYCIKPMNCPAHVYMFNNSLKSYRDLPIRMAEFGICHRNEFSGSLHGLLRLKSFTQDDAHIFCSEKSLKIEITNCIRMILNVYKILGFNKVHIKFSTRPKNKIGTEYLWNQAELNLKHALLDNNLNFEYQSGEGAFYGPKIEFILEDCFHRFWQCGTIQLDFYLPRRFSSYYIDNCNNKQIPIVIHRAILGSIERFIGILLEEYSGCLPIWLCPIQVVLISIHDNYNMYVYNIYQQLLNLGIRVKCDFGSEKINFKIRKYTMEYVPYILICGSKEVRLRQVSVRIRKNNSVKMMSIECFIHKIKNQIKMYCV